MRQQQAGFKSAILWPQIQSPVLKPTRQKILFHPTSLHRTLVEIQNGTTQNHWRKQDNGNKDGCQKVAEKVAEGRCFYSFCFWNFWNKSIVAIWVYQLIKINAAARTQYPIACTLEIHIIIDKNLEWGQLQGSVFEAWWQNIIWRPIFLEESGRKYESSLQHG